MRDALAIGGIVAGIGGDGLAVGKGAAPRQIARHVAADLRFDGGAGGIGDGGGFILIQVLGEGGGGEVGVRRSALAGAGAGDDFAVGLHHGAPAGIGAGERAEGIVLLVDDAGAFHLADRPLGVADRGGCGEVRLQFIGDVAGVGDAVAGPVATGGAGLVL